MILICPIKLFLFYLKYYESIRDNKIEAKYEILYINIKTDKIEYLLLNILLILRSIVYGVNMIVLYSSPYSQVVINSSFSFSIFYFIFIFKPFKNRLDNMMNLYIEFNTFLILSLMGAYIYEDLSDILYGLAEWALVILIYMSIIMPTLVNTIILIKNFILKLIPRRAASKVKTNIRSMNSISNI